MIDKKVNWRVYERDNMCPQNVGGYLGWIKLDPRLKFPSIPNNHEIFSFINGYVWWTRDTDLMQESIKKLIHIWITDKGKLKEIVDLFENSHSELQVFIPKLMSISVENITNEELWRLLIKTKDFMQKILTFSEYVVDYFDDYFGTVFIDFLQKNSGNKISSEDLGVIMQPAYVSVALQFQRALLDFSLNGDLHSSIGAIAQKYSWIRMSWDSSHEITVSEVEKDLININKISELDRKQELEKINNFEDDVKNKRDKIINKYSLPIEDVESYLNLLDLFTKFHEYRKELQMRCNQVIYPILREISQRFDVKYNDLLHYFDEEIKELCKNNDKVNLELIKERRKGVLWINNEGNIEEYIGDEAKEILDKLVLSSQKIENKNEIKGFPASPGKIKGRALVVKDVKIANREIKEGEILITSLTVPDYLPAMKKAGAIVTDEGGITSHAAIVSRELNVPCIIGTKIATKVLKDNMKVQVNANHGWVRILK